GVLMRRDRNACRKRRGNRIAIRQTVANMPQREPKAHHSGRRERDEKNNDEPVHWANVDCATITILHRASRESGMAQDQNNLVWLDMEMTGLDPDKDRIIEIAVVITDSQLITLAEAPVAVVHQPDAVLDAMDDWNK